MATLSAVLLLGLAASTEAALDLVEIFKGGPSSNPWSQGQFACYRIPSLVECVFEITLGYPCSTRRSVTPTPTPTPPFCVEEEEGGGAETAWRPLLLGHAVCCRLPSIFSSLPPHPAHAVWHALFRAQAHRMLVDACTPML